MHTAKDTLRARCVRTICFERLAEYKTSSVGSPSNPKGAMIAPLPGFACQTKEAPSPLGEHGVTTFSLGSYGRGQYPSRHWRNFVVLVGCMTCRVICVAWKDVSLCHIVWGCLTGVSSFIHRMPLLYEESRQSHQLKPWRAVLDHHLATATRLLPFAERGVSSNQLRGRRWSDIDMLGVGVM